PCVPRRPVLLAAQRGRRRAPRHGLPDPAAACRLVGERRGDHAGPRLAGHDGRLRPHRRLRVAGYRGMSASARAVALEAADTYQEIFADRFVAAYVLGSLAHGGYAPAVSDIDLAVILTDTNGHDADTVADAHQALVQRGALYRKLSVFWGSLA